MNFWKRVRKVLKKCNVVLEVLDARFAKEMRNIDLEQSCVRANKKLLIVINKSDLVSKENALAIKKEFSKDFPTVLVSVKKRIGKGAIKNFLDRFAKNRQAIVGVIGYPNTGKSSLINFLKGKKTAKTSILAGFTRGEQFFRLSENILLIDTPGVLPFFKGGEARLAIFGSKSPQALKDPINSAQKLLQELQKKDVKEVFGVKIEGKNIEKL
ncbi:MAG: 50S ribosome-binding GTPase, partial [Candidatus Diapherotrites archaeon]|nr:50S ribosome-binding GTPase [Candidatus Diapherotrites archaeon]